MPEAIRVLLVEDNPGDALLLRETVNEVQSEEIQIEWTQSPLLADALNLLTDHHSFDVVLLDLSLPDSHGLATFERVHQTVPNAPVVMLTGLDDETTAVAAMQRGAQDYLVKGQVDGHSMLRSIRYAIERTRRRQAEESIRQTQAEMRVAQTIQRKLFPIEAPSIEGFDIAGGSFPAEATGGDYYDYFQLDDGRWMLAVGDVSSHGFGPALLMAETRAYLRAFSKADCADGVNQIIASVNRALVEDTEAEHFVTMIVGLLDAQTRELTHASAGHPPGFVLDPAGNVRVWLQSTAFPLGVSEENPIEPAQTITLFPGELVVFSTDGIHEARDADHEQFGQARLVKVVHDNRNFSASGIVNAVRAAVRKFAGTAAQNDDITLVVMKVA